MRPTQPKTTTNPPAPLENSTTKKRPPVNPKWSPCVGCGGGSTWSGSTWPSYCRGWTCRTRYPQYDNYQWSARRCSPCKFYDNVFQIKLNSNEQINFTLQLNLKTTHLFRYS